MMKPSRKARKVTFVYTYLLSEQLCAMSHKSRGHDDLDAMLHIEIYQNLPKDSRDTRKSSLCP